MSKIICGNENRHVELRLRTFIELCLNRDKYLNNSYLKELTGLDEYMENLLGSSFDLPPKTTGKPKSERQREGFKAFFLIFKVKLVSSMSANSKSCKTIYCFLHVLCD